MFNAKRILIPMDFSPEAMLALQGALRIADNEPDAELYLLHVRSVVPEAAAAFGTVGYVTLVEQEIRDSMDKLVKELTRGIATHPVYRIGRPSHEIARVCKDLHIDLVVMTTHGRQGLDHWLRGSVSEETVRLASCPVLVLHMNPATVGSVSSVAL